MVRIGFNNIVSDQRLIGLNVKVKMNISFKELVRQKSNNINPGLAGLMLESFIHEGNQKLEDPKNLKYGVSITDPCIDWDETVELITEADKKLES